MIQVLKEKKLSWLVKTSKEKEKKVLRRTIRWIYHVKVIEEVVLSDVSKLDDLVMKKNQRYQKQFSPEKRL